MEKFIYNENKGELTGYNCNKCQNRGGYMTSKNGYTFYQECDCIKIRKAIIRLQNCGLGNLLKLCTFDNFKVEEDWQKLIYNSAKEFVNSNSKWFCIMGSSGIGKSHICTAISKELLLKGKELRYMRWLDDGNELKRNAMNNELYEKMIRDFKTVDVLYIDDFLKSENNTKPTPADIKLANEILNYRYDKARSCDERYITIISTERTLEQLSEYDMALAGRIIEMSKPNNLVRVFGNEKNYRLK